MGEGGGRGEDCASSLASPSQPKRETTPNSRFLTQLPQNMQQYRLCIKVSANRATSPCPEALYPAYQSTSICRKNSRHSGAETAGLVHTPSSLMEGGLAAQQLVTTQASLKSCLWNHQANGGGTAYKNQDLLISLPFPHKKRTPYNKEGGGGH